MDAEVIEHGVRRQEMRIEQQVRHRGRDRVAKLREVHRVRV